jgi:hypothetical protein
MGSFSPFRSLGVISRHFGRRGHGRGPGHDVGLLVSFDDISSTFRRSRRRIYPPDSGAGTSREQLGNFP